MENPKYWNKVHKTLNSSLARYDFPSADDVIKVLSDNDFLKSHPNNLRDIILKVLEQDKEEILAKEAGYSLGFKLHLALKAIDVIKDYPIEGVGW